MNKKTGKRIVAVVTVLAGSILLVASFLWYMTTVGNKVTGIVSDTMVVKCSADSKTFETKIDDELEQLEFMTKLFIGVDMDNYNQVKQTVQSIVETGPFEMIGVAMPSGATLNCNGKTAGNIVLYDFFNEAMQGSANISDMIFKDSNGVELFMAAVPIKNCEGEITGTLYGSFLAKNLDTLLADDVNDDCSLLINSAGDILLKSDPSDIMGKKITSITSNQITWNFESSDSYIEMGKEIKEGNAFSVAISVRNKQYLLCMTKLENHDWYYASIIPYGIVEEKITGIQKIGFTIMGIVALVAIGFAVMFGRLFSISSKIERTNEQYKLAVDQTRVLIFDYDFGKKKAELSGNVDFFVSGAPKTIQYETVKSIATNIHPDDRKIRETLELLVESDESVTGGEFRLKCTDGAYYWFKMKASVIRSGDGKPLRLVGNIINVQETDDKEAVLIHGMGTDSLTGLLTKPSFEERAENYLEKADFSMMAAMYIIDIDNFKAVNEILGHKVGEKVLQDVARKLCMVFSDADYVARTGGDEFAVLMRLSENGLKDGRKVIEAKAKNACNIISDTYSDGKRQVSISASIGVSTYPLDGKRYGEMYRKADAALYAAKHSGKDKYYIFKEESLI